KRTAELDQQNTELYFEKKKKKKCVYISTEKLEIRQVITQGCNTFVEKLLGRAIGTCMRVTWRGQICKQHNFDRFTKHKNVTDRVTIKGSDSCKTRIFM
ncbi:MAG: hypothetical protein AAGK05_08165, partial [Pseudomonadota bacterium]